MKQLEGAPAKSESPGNQNVIGYDSVFNLAS